MPTLQDSILEAAVAAGTGSSSRTISMHGPSDAPLTEETPGRDDEGARAGD